MENFKKKNSSSISFSDSDSPEVIINKDNESELPKGNEDSERNENFYRNYDEENNNSQNTYKNQNAQINSDDDYYEYVSCISYNSMFLIDHKNPLVKKRKKLPKKYRSPSRDVSDINTLKQNLCEDPTHFSSNKRTQRGFRRTLHSEPHRGKQKNRKIVKKITI